MYNDLVEIYNKLELEPPNTFAKRIRTAFQTDRQTGKTTRKICEAFLMAARKEMVFLVVENINQVRVIQRKINEYAQRLKIESRFVWVTHKASKILLGRKNIIRDL